MKVLVTGSNGFVGKNLVQTLKLLPNIEVFEYNRLTNKDEIDLYAKESEFIFHMAGVNRPEKEEEFLEGNFDLTLYLLGKLKEHGNRAPIVFSSSTQADLDNPYGKSKLASEQAIRDYSKTQNTKVYIYRLPNLFGKWSRPNYNSVVATFCYNIANDKKIEINNPNTDLSLAYIDDVVNEFLNALKGNANLVDDYCVIPVIYNVKLGKIAELVQSFKSSRTDLLIPDMSNTFVKKLYSTYLSYIPKNNFSYPLTMHKDERGSFTEFVKTPSGGQVSINVSKPGVTKGNHWHHTKNEKFLVVKGEGVIRLRCLFSEDILEYPVSERNFEVIEIPVGYTHSIVNKGGEDMITVMWVNELFDPNNPDTYFLEVLK